MTNETTHQPLITPAGYHNMRGLFAEHAQSHDSKIAQAETVIDVLDDETRPLTYAERQLCIEGLGLVIAQSRVSAELLRDGVAEIDQKTASVPPSAPAQDAADPEDGDAYGPAGTEYDHDDQDIGDVLGLDDDRPEF